MTVAINLTAIIIATVSLVIALASLAMVIGMKLSTHKIEFKPIEINDPFREVNEEADKTKMEDEDILFSALNLQRSKKKKKDEDPLDSILETANF